MDYVTGRGEPDADRGDIGRAGEDVAAFVVVGGHGAELFEFADGAFDGTALIVVGGVDLDH